MLHYLQLSNVGPAPEMELALAPRLNLLTGDNGLGKSFLLDVAWWALTRTWPHEVNGRLVSGHVAMPRIPRTKAQIRYRVDSQAGSVERTSTFDPAGPWWPQPRGRPPNAGLVVYGHADGGFSVWDPARNYWKRRDGGDDRLAGIPAFVFSPREVWDGLTRDVDGRETVVCRGLVDDWAIWIKENGPSAAQMARILVSPAAPGEKIELGPLRPLARDDAREYPTLRVPYAPEPVRIVHASAGLRRIAALAYMLMWSWERHRAYAESQGLAIAHSVIVLLDEVEAHLHPRWQRSILRSVLEVASQLHGAEKLQLIASTHSPLVLASAEPWFDAAQDAWFDLDLVDGNVALTARPFVRQGDVAGWLTSEAFDFKQAGSLEAEVAIEQARALLRSKRPRLEDARRIDGELRKVLDGLDPFWVRWSAFVDRLGARR